MKKLSAAGVPCTFFLLVSLLVSGCAADASKAQVRDCKAALKKVVQAEGSIPKKPQLCEPLTDRQYDIAVTEARGSSGSPTAADGKQCLR